jgi:hypothetical protein
MKTFIYKVRGEGNCGMLNSAEEQLPGCADEYTVTRAIILALLYRVLVPGSPLVLNSKDEQIPYIK